MPEKSERELLMEDIVALKTQKADEQKKLEDVQSKVKAGEAKLADLDTQVELQAQEKNKLWTETQDILKKNEEARQAKLAEENNFREYFAKVEADLKVREDNVKSREVAVSEADAELSKREESILAREHTHKEQVNTLEAAAKTLQDHAEKVKVEKRLLEEKSDRLLKKENDIEARETKFKDWEQSLGQRETDLTKLSQEVAAEKNANQQVLIAAQREQDVVAQQRKEAQTYINVMNELQTWVINKFGDVAGDRISIEKLAKAIKDQNADILGANLQKEPVDLPPTTNE